jgi:ribosomal protein L11 methyltransferase
MPIDRRTARRVREAIGLEERHSGRLRWRTVAEQNWVQLTQSQFDPIRVSERLWIVPSWHEAPDPAAINLILDPGHGLRYRFAPDHPACAWNGWSATFRGLRCRCSITAAVQAFLAIAAAKLWAPATSHGVDIDPQAVEAAKPMPSATV